MFIDQAGRQTPDMTGLTRTKGNGKPRIYKMADKMWVFQYTYGKGTVIRIFASWSRCVDELRDVVEFFRVSRIPRMFNPYLQSCKDSG